jgi:hypothetical protein
VQPGELQGVQTGGYASTARFSSFATSRMRQSMKMTGCRAQKQVTTWFNNARKRLLHQHIGPKDFKRLSR